MPGTLSGIRVVEVAGVGPGPFAAMMLADHGAEVIRVERPGGVRAGPPTESTKDILNRSRRSIIIDLKKPAGVAVMRDLCRSAAALIEGFRPGVMERLGLGPDVLLSDNPALVYGRVTGWGQTGPLAQAAGHDINYIALSGNLYTYGRAGGPPTPPANAVADFGGGGMLLAFGIVSAVLHARTTGQGQVIDCAMVDGAALLAAMTWSLRAMGLWSDERGVNLLDTGAPFYDTYETADGEHVAIGPIEPSFYAELVRLCGLEGDPDFAPNEQMNRTEWTRRRQKLARVFASRTRAEWCALLEGSDACFAPVLSMAEVPRHEHIAARGTFVDMGGVTQPAPAPRFSATPAPTPRAPSPPGADTDALLAELGYDTERIARLRAEGVL